MFLLVVQAVTGMCLALYYQAAEDMAYDSVRVIIAEAPFGWLVRSMHHWSANLVILSVLLHMAAAFAVRAYRRPRELLWITGCLGLFCLLGSGFSGYLLPWDELGFSATKVGTRIVGALPFIGLPLMKLLRGGDGVGGATLTRFHAIHVAILPLALIGLLRAHVPPRLRTCLRFVRKLGISPPPWIEARHACGRGEQSFLDSLMRDGMLWMALLGVVVTLAVLLPAGLGVRADPMKPAPAGIRPEWYFLFMFEALKHIPGRLLFIDGETVGVLAFTLAGLFVLVVPFVATTPQRQKHLNWLALTAVAFVAITTAIPLVSGEHPPQNRIVAEANRLTLVRVVGVVWTWAICAWVIAALAMKRRHRQWLRQVGYLKGDGSHSARVGD